MIEEEFYLAFLKKWYEFKDDIRYKMLSCNNRRMKWAWKKLGEVEKTFEGSWSIEEIYEFSKDILFQIKKIFNPILEGGGAIMAWTTVNGLADSTG